MYVYARIGCYGGTLPAPGTQRTRSYRAINSTSGDLVFFDGLGRAGIYMDNNVHPYVGYWGT